MATKDLREKIEVGGGATGTSLVPDPVGGTATLPASKKQGDSMQKLKLQAPEEETDAENNTAATGDMSAQNRATIASKIGAEIGRAHV